MLHGSRGAPGGNPHGGPQTCPFGWLLLLLLLLLQLQLSDSAATVAGCRGRGPFAGTQQARVYFLPKELSTGPPCRASVRQRAPHATVSPLGFLRGVPLPVVHPHGASGGPPRLHSTYGPQQAPPRAGTPKQERPLELPLEDLSGALEAAAGGAKGAPRGFLQPMDVEVLIHNTEEIRGLLLRRGAPKEAQSALEALPGEQAGDIRFVFSLSAPSCPVVGSYIKGLGFRI